MVKIGELNECERNLLASMVLKVAEHCLEKYDVIKKGIQEIMGGVLLDYPEKRILNEGRAEGRATERKKMVQNLMQSMGVSLEKACEILKVNKADLGMEKEKLTVYVMGGVLLDYPAKTIMNAGRAEGRAESRLEMVQNLMQSMGITVEKACELLKLNVDDYKSGKETLLLP